MPDTISQRHEAAQDDREAAADWLQSFDPDGYPYPSVRDGTGQANGIAEAFATHRAASEARLLARMVEAIEGERLTDDTGEKEDIAYNRAIDDALTAIAAKLKEPG